LQLFLFDEEIDLKHFQGTLIGERREMWLLLSLVQHLLGIFERITLDQADDGIEVH